MAPPSDAAGGSSLVYSEAVVGEAARAVANEFRGTLDRVQALAGAAGRLATDDDLRLHVQFLLVAAETSEPELFAEYIRWQRSLMEARGLPLQMLATTLAAIGAHLSSQMPFDAQSKIEAVVDTGKQALTEGTIAPGQLYHKYLPEPSPSVDRLVESLVAGDPSSCRSIAEKEARRSGQFLPLALHLFQPAMYRVGLMWQRGEISVAQEHMATAIVQTLLTQFYSASPFDPPTGRRVLFAAVQGNRHALGLRMVSDAFDLAGWSVCYLGADTPTEALVDQALLWRPDIVGLSASMAHQLPDLRNAVAALRATIGPDCPSLLVGGLALNQIDEIWRWTGADTWGSDARQALKTAA